MTTTSLSMSAANTPLPSHRWKVLGVGVAANACFAAAVAGIPTTAVFMRNDYHLNNAELGLILGLIGLGIAISEVPWGMLTDRWGDRNVLLTGLLSTACWFGLMSVWLVPSATQEIFYTYLALAMLVVGVLGGSVNGSSGRAVMLWFREGERGLAMSIRQTAVPLGGGIGALVLPGLAQHFGFVAVFAGLGLAALLTALLTWLWIYEPPGSVHVTLAPANATSALAEWQIWRVCLGLGCLCMPQVAVLTFAAVFLHDFLHIHVALASVCIATVQLGAAITRVWSGRWTDRHQNRRYYLRLCSHLTAVVFIVLTALSWLAAQTSVPAAYLTTLMMLTLVLGGIVASAWHGVAYTELANIAGADRVGAAFGLANTFAFSTFFVVPLAIPALLTISGWGGVWLLASLSALLSYVLFPQILTNIASPLSPRS